MAISYNKQRKLLVDKKMSKADLRKAAGLVPNTMTKLRRDEPVAMGVPEKNLRHAGYGLLGDHGIKRKSEK